MPAERPDLSQVSPEVRDYIEALETKIADLESASAPGSQSALSDRPSEAPTSINMITVSQGGGIKRSPRHLYPRQRRGGMGLFDLETPEADPPAHLAAADLQDTLLLLNDQGRAFYLPVKDIPETPVRSRGEQLADLVPALSDEPVVFLGPLQNQGALALVSERGYVRVLRHNYVGTNQRTGAQLLDVGRFGPLAAAGWVGSQDDLFISTRQGLAIRFRARLVHPNGSLGIRLDRGDLPVAITGVQEDSQVFLLGENGKGTLRLMSGFRANKAPGAGGKTALKTDRLVAAFSVQEGSDIFIISQLSKLIRFPAEEIPPKAGVVQGVNCMTLRADQCAAAAWSKVSE